jgi:hypothetical protein
MMRIEIVIDIKIDCSLTQGIRRRIPETTKIKEITKTEMTEGIIGIQNTDNSNHPKETENNNSIKINN